MSQTSLQVAEIKEPLAVFALSKDDFAPNSPKGPRLKSKVLMPDERGERSSFQVGGLSENERWELGQREVGDKRKPEPKPVLARGDLSLADVLGCGLQLDPDDNPPRHVNIIG